MRTSIKAERSLNFSQLRLLIRELAASSHHRLIIGKWFLHASLLIFDRVIIKVAGIQDGHKSMKEFEPRREKTGFCKCENKDADQLRGNREADQRLCFRYTDSTIPLLSISEISSF